METIRLKYGEKEVTFDMNHSNLLGIAVSKGLKDKKSEYEIIKQALENPIESQQLGKLVKPGETVCIVISDITRAWQKVSSYLPYIVQELNEAGIQDQDITLLCATGSHRSQTREEHDIIIGEELAQRFEVIDHDCKDGKNLVSIGITSLGTPVIINRKALECNHIVLTGAIVFHDLAGWGGGKKSILPGIAAYESIMANHKLSLDPEWGKGTNALVRCGNIMNNPVHLDMLEAAALVKPAFLFNVIMDEDGNIGAAVAGNYIKAHEAGQHIVNEADSIYLKEKADILVASAGGFPKDIDLYQASKSLSNAKEAVKEGGTIILLAECAEGFGGAEVQQMLEEYSDNYSREKALREIFSIAKYTGYLMAEIAERFNVILVSSLKQEQLLKANIKAAASFDEALDIAKQQQGDAAKIYVMPYASNTLPRISMQ